MHDKNENKSILVVDDDEIQLDFIGNMLKTEYAIIKVKSGDEALEYLYDHSVPDLILLDILMPNMDGWEVFSKIREISLLEHVPIIFLTALKGTDEEKRGLAMGAADYVKKPIDKKELTARIKKALEKNQC